MSRSASCPGDELGAGALSAQQLISLLDADTRQQLSELVDAVGTLEALLREVPGSWPAFSLTAEDFGRYLAERLPRGEQMDRALPRWCVAELYLCCACALGDSAAIASFYRQYVPLIRSKIRRMNISSPLSEDIEQGLLDQLLVGREQTPPMLTRYQGLGRLGSWLRVVVTRTAQRTLQRERGLIPVDDGQLARQLIGDERGADLRSAKRAYRDAFKQAFKQALTRLSARQSAVLRYRFADGLGLEHIGAIYRVHHSTVHRWLASIRADLLRDTELFLVEELRLDDGECQSIIRLIQSDFDMTLHTFLSDRDGSEGH